MTDHNARSYLLSQLQAHLYRSFYVRGGCDSSVWENSSSTSDLTSFRDDLSFANMGTGCMYSGWNVLASTAQEVVVRRGTGLMLMVRPEDCFAASGVVPQPGSIVSLRTHKELVNASPGYYMAVSNRDHRQGDVHPRLRIYWNLKPEGAAQLIQVCTRELNERDVFFHLKVLNDPAAYSRCDAGVLYLHKADYPVVVAVLKHAVPQIAPHLKAAVPLFTKSLAPGVGFAEDPGGGESFGQHRCRILADGMICAYEQKARSLNDRLLVVVDRFVSATISLDTPYLNPGSVDGYSLETRCAA